MQERYLGDVHDYVKFALLRHLHDALGVRLGVNWYRTDPGNLNEGINNHGEQRGYRNDGKWRRWNAALFEELEPFQDPGYRVLNRFQKSGVLPEGTLYFGRELAPATDRGTWHSTALSELAKADLIFMDPDNGFQVASMTPQTSPKYALFNEVAAYFKAGKIAVCIQFAARTDPVLRAESVHEQLAENIQAFFRIPVLRGRVIPNILFITICPSNRIQEVGTVLKSFAANSPFFKWDRKKQRNISRVELIP